MNTVGRAQKVSPGEILNATSSCHAQVIDTSVTGEFERLAVIYARGKGLIGT